MKVKILFNIILFFIFFNIILNQESPSGLFSITRIHYPGGGDWYSDPSSIPNLLSFVKNNTNIQLTIDENRAKIGDDAFYNGNYYYMTGHGNISFSEKEISILRKRLLNGAFLHADDNYGMDQSFRREFKKVFPDKQWVELPSNHEIFNIFYKFNNGLPKIHEHNNDRPQALALFHNKKIIVLYTFESDLGDGWENKNVHHDPEDLRELALKMGTNIIIYSIIQ